MPHDHHVRLLQHASSTHHPRWAPSAASSQVEQSFRCTLAAFPVALRRLTTSLLPLATAAPLLTLARRCSHSSLTPGPHLLRSRQLPATSPRYRHPLDSPSTLLQHNLLQVLHPSCRVSRWRPCSRSTFSTLLHPLPWSASLVHHGDQCTRDAGHAHRSQDLVSRPDEEVQAAAKGSWCSCAPREGQ